MTNICDEPKLGQSRSWSMGRQRLSSFNGVMDISSGRIIVELHGSNADLVSVGCARDRWNTRVAARDVSAAVAVAQFGDGAGRSVLLDSALD